MEKPDILPRRQDPGLQLYPELHHEAFIYDVHIISEYWGINKNAVSSVPLGSPFQ
jgi:hypothetical protein